MKHYWINIDSRIDRRKHTEEQFNKFNIDNERISAVTPETLDNYNIIYYDDKVRTKAEYSCIISHINAIKKGYEDGYEYFCVTEDDFVLQKPLDFDKIFQLSENIEKENNDKIEIIQMHINNSNYIKLLYNNFIKKNKFIIKRTLPEYEEAWGATYYLISRTGAKKILDTFIENNNIHLKKYYNHCVADDILYNIVNTYILTYPVMITNLALYSNINMSHIQFHYNNNYVIEEIWKNKNLLDYFT